MGLNLRHHPVSLFLALLLALAIAGLSARRLLQETQVQSIAIAVAARPLLSGSHLERSGITWVAWPARLLPAHAMSDPDHLEGRYLRMPVAQGMPILDSALAPAGSHGGLSTIISPGQRAMTVRVNEVVGVAGFALPGNFVDVLVNSPAADHASASRSISKIVLEHILVLAIAQEANTDETRPHVVNAVTLEVTPRQAEVLDLARNIGSLSLVLRNQDDPLPSHTPGVTRIMLLDGLQSAPWHAAGTELIRGTERSRAPW